MEPGRLTKDFDFGGRLPEAIESKYADPKFNPTSEVAVRKDAPSVSMTEAKAISVTNTPHHIPSLISDLQAAGIDSSDVLIVHSSLSSIGYVIGGPVTVIDALMKHLHKGTLALPAFSTDLTDPALWMFPPVPADWVPIVREHMPVFDRRVTPTRGVGVIPEIFRNYPGVLRSDHPW